MTERWLRNGLAVAAVAILIAAIFVGGCIHKKAQRGTLFYHTDTGEFTWGEEPAK